MLAYICTANVKKGSLYDNVFVRINVGNVHLTLYVSLGYIYVKTDTTKHKNV